MAAAPAAPVASQAQAVLRGRLCDPAFVHSRLRSSPDTNYSKLKYLVSSSVSEACNNSVLLLGPRGCGKGAVLDMVLEDLKEEHPDAISVIRLNGMLHSDDNCATKVSTSADCIKARFLPIFAWKLPGSCVWSINCHFPKWLLRMTTLNS
ncbi:hypothetical protein ACQJBY_023129 [Aegilops geniculata]